MAKKKKHEEHENLERWLVSYADFMTLLFATFVVLYALSQIDVAGFKALEDSIQKAFAAPSLMQGSQGLMDSKGDSILDGGASKDMNIVPPILEYMSPSYEQNSFKEIENSIKKLSQEGELQGVDAQITSKGLVIKLDNIDLFFESGAANLKKNSEKGLDIIGNLINQKFKGHLIRVEGHTDNIPTKSNIYPSNWELSSARASSVVRYLIKHFKFNEQRFAAIGYGDSRPVSTNATASGRLKNRRVEIIVLNNKYAQTESDINQKELMAGISKELPQEKSKPELKDKIIISDNHRVSEAAQKLAKESGQPIKNVLVVKDSYSIKSEQIANEIKQKEKSFGYTPKVKSTPTVEEKPIEKPTTPKTSLIEIKTAQKEKQKETQQIEDTAVTEKIFKKATNPLGN